jgi:hypothetical protein
MTLECKVEVIQSFMVHLLFEDESTKDRLVAINDLISVTWNGNGARKFIIGRVAAISASGSNHNDWYMIVDGADDFSSRREKISPYQILDLEILRKADMEDLVRTVKGDCALPYIRINQGRLQYSLDGFNWQFIKIDSDDIMEQEGTVPIIPPPAPPKPPINDIEDAVY